MKINERNDVIYLSDFIDILKYSSNKKIKNNKKVKNLVPTLEKMLDTKGDIKIPIKDLKNVFGVGVDESFQTMSGGKGDHLNPEDVDQNELKVGIEVEYEHAKGDKIAALDIALDHLAEDPNYYTKLVKSGIVDEPKAIKMAKKLLNVEPVNENIRTVIREELKSLLKEEPEMWKYIYNFGNTYVPKKQIGR